MANTPFILNFKTRMLLIVIGLIVAVVWGFAVHMASLLRTDLEVLVSAQLLSQVDFIAREVDSDFQFRIDTLNEIAASLPSDLLADPAQLQSLLLRRQIFTTLFPLGILVIDRQGRIVADYGARLPFPRSGMVNDRDYFLQVMASGKPFIGGPIKSRFAERVIVPISVPLFDRSGKVAGVLLNPADPFERDFLGKIKNTKMGKSGKLLVLSAKDNLIVAATEENRVMTPPPKRGVNPLLDRRLSDGFEGAGVTINSQGVEVVSANRNMKTTGWLVIASLDTAEAFAPIKSLTRNIYLTAVLLSLLVAVTLAVFLKQQMRPLDEAGAAMQRMTDGTEPLAAIPVTRSDEIGRLVMSFNRLIESRRQVDEKIFKLNQGLEQRVSDRTHELQAAVAARDKEISVRAAAEQEALIYAQRLRVMTRRLVEVEESERHELARELHDRVSSNLTAIKLYFKAISSQAQQLTVCDLDSRLADLTALIDDAIASARDIVSDLHPATLTYGNLIAELEQYAAKFERRTGIRTKLTLLNARAHLTHDQVTALFRITQEALTNSAKHGDPKTIEICLNGDAASTILKIADDGSGFDPANLGDHGQRPGLGLLSMQERAEAAGGTFLIESAPGFGTRIAVQVWHAETEQAV